MVRGVAAVWLPVTDMDRAVISSQPDGDDIVAEVERLQAAGVELPGGVSSYDWGRLAPFKDSEGNDLQLYAPPA